MFIMKSLQQELHLPVMLVEPIALTLIIEDFVKVYYFLVLL